MTDSLATHPAAQLVPASYAEKAMASLMQLHSELMDEKERRVDLFRKLMEREQSLAELKMYVKLLEEKLAPVAVAPTAVAPPLAPGPGVVAEARPPPPSGRLETPRSVPRVPPRMVARPRLDGWKTW